MENSNEKPKIQGEAEIDALINDKSNLPASKQIELLFDKIEIARSIGRTDKEIVDSLKKAGIKIAIDHFRTIMNRIRRSRKKAALKEQPAASAPASPVVMAPAPAPVEEKTTSTPPAKEVQVVEKAVVIAEKPATEKTNFREVMRLKREAMENEIEYEHL